MNRFYKFFIFIASIALLATVLLATEQKAFAAEQKVYIVGINNDNSKLEMQDITVTVANFVKENPFDEPSSYTISLLSIDNKILFKTRFDFTSTSEYKEITIPYFSNGMEIKISDKNGSDILDKSVIQFAQTCGNGTCELQENYKTCPQDCRAPTPVTKDNNLTKNNMQPLLVLIGGIATIIVLTSGAIYWSIRRKKQLPPQSS